MSAESEASQSLDPFETWRAARDASLESWRSMRDAGLASWSKIMIDFVNSEEYSEVTARWLDTYLTVSQPFKQAIEKTMTQVLTGLNMPTRTDVISLATRLTNIEIRLDDLDAKLDDMQRAIQTLSTLKDDVQRAVQALSALKDSVDASSKALTSPTNNAGTSTAKQPGGKQGKAKEAH